MERKIALNWSDYKKLYTQHEHPPSTIFHKYVSKKIAKYITYIFLHLGVSPNLLTIFSFLLILISVLALNLIQDTYQAFITFLMLTQLSYAIDCSDGVVARINKKASKFGGFLDLSLDRLAAITLMFGLLIYFYNIKSTESEIISIFLGSMMYQYYSYLSDIRGFMYKELKGYTKRSRSRSLFKGFVLIIYEFIDTGTFYFLVFLSLVTNFVSEVFVFYFIISLILVLANYFVLYKENN